MRNSWIGPLAFTIAALMLASCTGDGERQHIAQVTTGGNAAQGVNKIQYYGCGSCHVIPGVSGARGLAGPPLTGIANRIYIGGVLQNTPENMMRWIQNPRAIDEKTVMPNLGVNRKDARDIAGYLYSLR